MQRAQADAGNADGNGGDAIAPPADSDRAQLLADHPVCHGDIGGVDRQHHRLVVRRRRGAVGADDLRGQAEVEHDQPLVPLGAPLFRLDCLSRRVGLLDQLVVDGPTEHDPGRAECHACHDRYRGGHRKTDEQRHPVAQRQTHK